MPFSITLCTLLVATADLRIPGGSPILHLIGRHSNQVPSQTAFDWIGSGFSIKLLSQSNKNRVSNQDLRDITADLEAPKDTRFSVFKHHLGGKVDAKIQLLDFFAIEGRRNYTLARVADSDECILSLIKTSENRPEDMAKHEAVQLYAVGLSGSGGIKPAPFAPGDVPTRHVDVYGDSDSASYGVDANKNSDNCDHNQTKQENFAHGWVTRVADQLNAELHVQAVSGIGVVKNAMDGKACSTTVTLPNLIKRTLQSVEKDDYNATLFSKPDVVVVYVGSNDYVNLLSPSKAKFMAVYENMVLSILAPWTGIAASGKGKQPLPAVVHVCGGEPTPCHYIQEIAEKHEEAGNWVSVYTPTGDKGVPKGGCGGHRNTTQQVELAGRLSAVIAAAAEWA